MDYCTLQDLTRRYTEEVIVQLTDRSSPPTGVIDEAVVAEAIADASGFIDSFLAGRYALPLATVPATLRGKACDLALYLLHVDDPPARVKDARDHAESWLRAVQAGRAHIGVATSGEAPASTDGAQMVGGGRIFGRDQGGYV